MYMVNKFLRIQGEGAHCAPPGGGTPIWNGQGCSSEILNLIPKPLKETMWAWLELFVTPKGDQSGRG